MIQTRCSRVEQSLEDIVQNQRHRSISFPFPPALFFAAKTTFFLSSHAILVARIIKLRALFGALDFHFSTQRMISTAFFRTILCVSNLFCSLSLNYLKSRAPKTKMLVTLNSKLFSTNSASFAAASSFQRTLVNRRFEHQFFSPKLLKSETHQDLNCQLVKLLPVVYLKTSCIRPRSFLRFSSKPSFL